MAAMLGSIFIVVLWIYIAVIAVESKIVSKTILCVGDSLTFGTGSSGPMRSYPALLPDLLQAELLSKHKQSSGHTSYNLTVVNLGVRGATATKISTLPYVSTSEYSRLEAFKGVSVVVLLLGANDATYANHWDQSTFVKDYLELVLHLQNLDGHPVVFICIPTVLLPRYASSKMNATVTNFIYPQLFPELQQRSHSRLIDLYRPMGGNVSTDIWQCCHTGTIRNFNNGWFIFIDYYLIEIAAYIIILPFIYICIYVYIYI
jgi:lysophospholipase L1-like esterase